MTKEKCCVIISGCWPSDKKGYELACRSTLDFIHNKYTKVIYIGPQDESFDDDIKDNFPNVIFDNADFNREAKPIRFLKSLFLGCPAICIRFNRAKMQIINKLKAYDLDSPDFFYEDIPAAFLMSSIKRVFPMSKQIVRSHNAVFKGFYGMRSQGGFISRFAWKIETDKIKAFEIFIAKNSTHFICISDDDEKYYRDIDIRPDSVLGIHLNESSLCFVPEVKNLIHIGTADLRKGKSLKTFIETSWPEVRAKHPSISFYIAGKGTEVFNKPEEGIFSLGFILDESEIFSKGGIFINPQEEGAGVKIKSLVALNNNCCLVTTPVGVEGINVTHEENVIISPDVVSMGPLLIKLLSDDNHISQIRSNGYKFIRENYNKQKFFKDASNVWAKIYD